jgi:hypothetical protein
MEHLPFLLPATFLLTTIFTVWLFYRAAPKSIKLVAGWLLLQAGLTLAGFYLKTTGTPPRFALLIVPPVLLIIITIFRKGTYNLQNLTLIHVVRIPVELVLYGLYLQHAVPKLMTFEGGNLDIISGLSALFVYYFGFVKSRISRGWLIAWNLLCVALLFNIMARAVLSAPFDFQQLGFEQPNIALLYFPFSWLPGFVVPAVLFAHLVTLRQLFSKRYGKQ